MGRRTRDRRRVRAGRALHPHEAGRVVDEYLSVPEYYGPRPRDAIALAANRRVARGSRAPTRGSSRSRSHGDVAGGAAAGAGAARVDRRGDRARGRRARLAGLVITLYDAPRCPYCARVRIVLAEKGLSYETVEIDLRDRPVWLYDLNPVGKVPVLDEDGWILPESAVIGEYLNERYPDPPLWPDDPGERAAGPPARLPLRGLLEALLRGSPRRGGAGRLFDEELAALDARCSPACPG